MNKKSGFNNLKVTQCLKKDWSYILELLHETKLALWLTGKEKYQDFYIVKDLNTNKAIACFSISKRSSVGILKNFAVSKTLQRKGIGTHIANKLIPTVAKTLKIERLYLQGNNKKPYTSNSFWEKTVFEHIESKKIKDRYFKKYFDWLVKKYTSSVLYKESVFYLEL